MALSSDKPAKIENFSPTLLQGLCKERQFETSPSGHSPFVDYMPTEVEKKMNPEVFQDIWNSALTLLMKKNHFWNRGSHFLLLPQSIRERVLSSLLQYRGAGDWEFEYNNPTAAWKGNQVEALIMKLSWTIYIYNIWKERNQRVFWTCLPSKEACFNKLLLCFGVD